MPLSKFHPDWMPIAHTHPQSYPSRSCHTSTKTGTTLKFANVEVMGYLYGNFKFASWASAKSPNCRRHSRNATMAASNFRCIKSLPRGKSPEEKSSSIVDFGGAFGFDGSTLISSILDTEPMGCRTYPSNWKFSFSATVATRRSVWPQAALISFHSTLLSTTQTVSAEDLFIG